METLKTIRLYAVDALAALAMTACSDDDDTPAAPEKEILVTKMEHNVKFVVEGYEDILFGAKNDISEMKYDGQGRLIEWVNNGKCAGHYTYEKGKILLTDNPKHGSIEFHLNDKEQLAEAVFTDGSVDKVTYNNKGQCVEVNQGGKFRTIYEWDGDDVVFMSFPDYEEEIPRIGLTITYSNIPKKSNAPYLRCMLANSSGYRLDMEIVGVLQISSEKYLPTKAVMEWEDGLQDIFEATYELDPDGVVTVMHVIRSQRYDASSEAFTVYTFDEEFTYQQK